MTMESGKHPRDAGTEALLSTLAQKRYGEERAAQLEGQISIIAAAIAAVGAYPLATDVEPWRRVPAAGLSLENATGATSA